MQNTLGSATQRRKAVIVNIDSWIIDNSKDLDNDYFNFCLVHGLNAWGRVTHICVGNLNLLFICLRLIGVPDKKFLVHNDRILLLFNKIHRNEVLPADDQRREQGGK